jgi:hypothetical protein
MKGLAGHLGQTHLLTSGEYQVYSVDNHLVFFCMVLGWICFLQPLKMAKWTLWKNQSYHELAQNSSLLSKLIFSSISFLLVFYPLFIKLIVIFPYTQLMQLDQIHLFLIHHSGLHACKAGALHLSHTSSSSCCCYFGDGISQTICPAGLKPRSSWSQLSK